MMRSTTTVLHCDGDDGACGAWDLDWYATGASAIDGVRLTSTARAPGWTTTDTADLCPKHAP